MGIFSRIVVVILRSQRGFADAAYTVDQKQGPCVGQPAADLVKLLISAQKNLRLNRNAGQVLWTFFLSGSVKLF
jgi:hypothetical protein